MGAIKVLKVDDEGLFRDMLLRLLSPEDRVDVVGAARNGTEAIRLAIELEPDVVLMDIELGGGYAHD
jgi:chemotaxis response regulator CheB